MEFLDILKIVLLGIIEGITEWLPVSSTGHLILFDRVWGFHTQLSDSFIGMFEYVIQLAAILAVVVLFWHKLFPLGKNTTDNGNAIVWKKDVLTMWLKIIVACIPALAAILLDELFDSLDEWTKTTVIAAMLIVYGVAFLLVEGIFKKNPKVTEISQLSFKYAFLIGCAQVLATIPGTSRSGVTILAALLLGVDRTTSAEFTFFLAIPTMVGSSAYKLLGFFLDNGTMSGAELGYLLIGSAMAFAVSLFAVKFLMNFVKKHSFKPFGWYRIALGIVVIAALVLPNCL